MSTKTSIPRSLFEGIEGFKKVVDSVHGACLDNRAGRLAFLAQLNSMGLETQQSRTVFYGKGDPNTMQLDDVSHSGIEHFTSASDLLARNQHGAANETLLCNMALVFIFQVWDEDWRQRIAESLGYKVKSDLKLDVMGDLRNFRNSIIHHRGVAKTECDRNKVLRWFQSGEKICVTPDLLLEAKVTIHFACGDLVRRYCWGEIP